MKGTAFSIKQQSRQANGTVNVKSGQFNSNVLI